MRQKTNSFLDLCIKPSPLAGQVIYHEDARALVAKACDGIGISSKIFARDQEGKTLNGASSDFNGKPDGYGHPPIITFGQAEGGVRMYGIGREGMNILLEQSPTILKALSEHLGGSVSVETKMGALDLDRDDDGQVKMAPVAYRIKTLVVAKKKNQIDAILNGKQPTLEAMTPAIIREIERGILSFTDMLDREGVMLDVPLNLNIRVSGGKPVWVPVKEIKNGSNGIKVSALAVRNLEFTMSAGLQGPWLAGHLRSRGFGLIRKAIKEWKHA